MSAPWFLFSILVPLATAVAVRLALGRRTAPEEACIALNALMPGTGLAAAGRPALEIAAGAVFATVSLLTVGRMGDLGYWVPIMMVGGAWAALHTRFNPLTHPPRQSTSPDSSPAASASAPRPGAASRPPVARATGEEPPGSDSNEQTGYAVSLRCTECGASLDIPVLQHMARCPFCGSDHLVVGHDACLALALPERLSNPGELRQAVLDHYRYRHYLKLYRRHVAPLEQRAVNAAPESALAVRAEPNPAAIAMEKVISMKADAFRARLDPKLRLEDPVHFLTPYRHGMGTLFQAAFGRSTTDQEKALRFAIGTVEAATLATTATTQLPPMGRLSYLRALRPVAEYPPDTLCLPLAEDDTALLSAFGDLDRKRLVRELSVIRHKSIFSREVQAVVWRPWWVVTVLGPNLNETLLVDSAAGSVVGSDPLLDRSLLTPLGDSTQSAGGNLRFTPMECPTCGFEFPFDVNALLHFCANCHRLFRLEGERKVEVDYDHDPSASGGGDDVVPFWRFELRLRTGDGQLVTDLRHLKDGIDGTLDQIGDDAELDQHRLFVPAVRCVNSRLMARAFTRLLAHTLSRPPRMVSGRFPLEDAPRPWPVCLRETEARDLAPLYLGLVFDRRDLARVNVHQVASWLLEARLESDGRLVYLGVPRAVTETFRAYVGRFRARALADAKDGQVASPGR